jgi:hypothetical protein
LRAMSLFAWQAVGEVNTTGETAVKNFPFLAARPEGYARGKIEFTGITSRRRDE